MGGKPGRQPLAGGAAAPPGIGNALAAELNYIKKGDHRLLTVLVREQQESCAGVSEARFRDHSQLDKFDKSCDADNDNQGLGAKRLPESREIIFNIGHYRRTRNKRPVWTASAFLNVNALLDKFVDNEGASATVSWFSHSSSHS